MKKYVLRFLAFAMILVLSLSALSCGAAHECTFGEWATVTEPTVTKAGLAKRVCECGESETKNLPEIGISTVKKRLQGSWQNYEKHIYIKFNGDRFISGNYVGGVEIDLLNFTGTYTISDTKITLTEDDGSTFTVIGLTISGSEIKLSDSEGNSYLKY